MVLQNIVTNEMGESCSMLMRKLLKKLRENEDYCLLGCDIM
jgi:hypothetical protein